jgi:hypothetical protein
MTTAYNKAIDAESARLAEDAARVANWKRWGPYLSERQWGTVREDYSANGDCWNYFPHDHARSRAYRWGEDGLLGITDREGRLCFALGLWNQRDPILKERLFGLTNPQGNHGEDVKECYFYLDSTPTHSYMKALYKYPQREFPYQALIDQNSRRGPDEPEFELIDTGAFDDSAYFDVVAEYAKGGPNDILIRISITNRSDKPAAVHVLPTLWFRNTWSWGRVDDSCPTKPLMRAGGDNWVAIEHPTLGQYQFCIDNSSQKSALLFTENDTNVQRLYGMPNPQPHVKDAFNDLVVHGRGEAVNPNRSGTKCAAHLKFEIEAGGTRVIRLRLFDERERKASTFGREFDELFEQRIAEANEFYESRIPRELDAEQRGVARQAYAGLLWSKQFYHYVVQHWLEGDAAQPTPPQSRSEGRNADWHHLYNRDVISMPDKWEYPWYAAWDLAFHMVPFARLDPQFAKDQLLLFLREWYMHPNGQIPAYEFALGDVNPPVHAWACWRVYKMTGPRGGRDRQFLVRAFQKLLINFTWWVNRKDIAGKHIFAGGFLGLDNIGVFDRSQPLPIPQGAGHLEQADGTAWMAFYCITMLAMALELASEDPTYEDVASKFFEHFVAIADAMNTLGGTGLWDEQDGFYYDQLHVDGQSMPLRVRSMVGLIPLFAVGALEDDVVERLPGFRKRMEWFLEHRKDLARHITCMEAKPGKIAHAHHLLAIPSRERLERVLRYLFDSNEFLSDFGVRSLSRYHQTNPYILKVNDQEFKVQYTAGESTSGIFGGNSNWRGPIWFPVNYLIIEALERYDFFYGDSFKVECPTASGRFISLSEAAQELRMRLTRLFLPSADGRRPCHGDQREYAKDPHWRELVLFYEYFHGEDGRGIGANHQTGWTALAAMCMEKLNQSPADQRPSAATSKQSEMRWHAPVRG